MFIFCFTSTFRFSPSILLQPDLSKNSRTVSYCFKVLPISIHGTDLYIYIYYLLYYIYTYLHRSHKYQLFIHASANFPFVPWILYGFSGPFVVIRHCSLWTWHLWASCCSYGLAHTWRRGRKSNGEQQSYGKRGLP